MKVAVAGDSAGVPRKDMTGRAVEREGGGLVQRGRAVCHVGVLKHPQHACEGVGRQVRDMLDRGRHGHTLARADGESRGSPRALSRGW